MTNIIAVDVGGTNTRVALFDDAARVHMVGAPARRHNTHQYAADIAYIVETARSLSGNRPITALGIGVPGKIREDRTGMIRSNNLPEWIQHNFCDDLAQALHCPVYMDNDALAAGLGEGYFGEVADDFHYLVWGTGVGGVAIRQGPDEAISAVYIRPRYQNLFEAWEHECGGAAFERLYGKPGEQLTSAEWERIDAAFVRYLQEYIAVAQPPAIVFGGGLAIHHAKTIAAYAHGLGVAVRVTQFGEASGLVGGLALVRRGIVSAAGQ